MTAIGVFMRRDSDGHAAGVDVWFGEDRKRLTVDEAAQLVLDLDVTVRVARREQEIEASPLTGLVGKLVERYTAEDRKGGDR